MRSILVLPLLLIACADQAAPPAAQSADDGTRVPAANAAATSPGNAYDFSAPDATFELPESLQEISGITVMPDGRLAAVQDEAGLLFTIDPQWGRIVGEQPFAGPGDYEDVEHVAGVVWVLEANGDLFELPQGGGDSRAHETSLKKKCDAEGLALDQSAGRLLISCKEDPGEGSDENTHRAIYAFDLATRELDETPAFLLDRDALDDDENFKPSALAVHPATGEIYVLSSVRRAIAIVGAGGDVTSVIDLPAGLNAQPEGLAFGPDGVLYLSNEGPEGPATLQRFTPRR